jgi:hypothetical protein
MLLPMITYKFSRVVIGTADVYIYCFTLSQGSRWIRSEPFLSVNVSIFFHTQLFTMNKYTSTFVYRECILDCWLGKQISLTLR